MTTAIGAPAIAISRMRSTQMPIRVPAVRMPWPIALLVVYLMLVTMFGKGPTYLIYPPVYLGEIVMVASVGWCLFTRGVRRFFLPDETALTLLVLCFFLLGAVIALPGIRQYGMNAIRDSALWYYAIFYFVGMEVARREELAQKIWVWVAIGWVCAMLWGAPNLLASQIFASRPVIGPILPWRGEPLFAHSGYEVAQHVALGSMIVLNPRLRGKIFKSAMFLLAPFGIFGALMAATEHGRGVRVGLILGILLTLTLYLAPARAPIVSRRFGIGLLCSAMLLGAGFVIAPEFVAKRTNLGRFTGGGTDQANTEFRLIWWAHLFQAVNTDNPAFGLGFGETLSIYNPIINRDPAERWPVRSPHNINITVFSRMGYVGSAIWVSILSLGLGGLFRQIWKGGWRRQRFSPERREHLAFWLVMLIATWVNSTFDVLMEGPVLGIWFWFALGFSRRLSRPTGVVHSPGIPAYGGRDVKCAY
jgi:O-Antigen ligase